MCLLCRSTNYGNDKAPPQRDGAALFQESIRACKSRMYQEFDYFLWQILLVLVGLVVVKGVSWRNHGRDVTHGQGGSLGSGPVHWNLTCRVLFLFVKIHPQDMMTQLCW